MSTARNPRTHSVPSTAHRRAASESPGMPPEAEVRGRGVETEPAVGVTSYLLAGPLCFGGIGYGLDRWLGTTGVVAVGVLLGMALSLYVIWLRYGGGAGSSTNGAPSESSTQEVTPARVDHATNATNEESQ